MIKRNKLLLTTTLPPGSTSDDLQIAVNNATFGDIISISSDMQFLGTVIIPLEKEITIQSNLNKNWSLVQTNPIRHFIINGILNLLNITLDGNESAGGISVESDAILNIYTGVVITKCHGQNGGALEVRGTLNMYTGELSYNGADFGGAVFVDTGGIFYLFNGVITNNGSLFGAGVYVKGIFNMINGTIKENKANNDGGGIYIEDATYQTLHTSNEIIFNNNIALAAYVPPINASTLYPNIGFSSTSIMTHPLNNYDINFTNTHFNIVYYSNGGIGEYIGPNILPGEEDTILTPEEASIINPTFIFLGWNTNRDGSGTTYQPASIITLDTSLVLYAQWQPNEVVVTFESNGGTPIQEQRVPFSTIVIKPNNPTKSGNIFEGWFFDNGRFLNEYQFDTAIEENLTLYAKWQPFQDEHNVTFESNGGTPVTSQVIPVGEVATMPANPSRTGYTFAGWYLDNTTFLNRYDFSTLVIEDITLYANWVAAPKQYVVTFQSNGGTSVNRQIIIAGGTAKQPTNPTRAGYIFAGWYLDNNTFLNAYNFSAPVTRNITLYAKWQVKKYLINFDSNCGTLVAPQEIIYGEKVIMPFHPMKNCYIFCGWYSCNENDYFEKWDFNTAVTKSITLYAKWEKYSLNNYYYKRFY